MSSNASPRPKEFVSIHLDTIQADALRPEEVFSRRSDIVKKLREGGFGDPAIKDAIMYDWKISEKEASALMKRPGALDWSRLFGH